MTKSRLLHLALYTLILIVALSCGPWYNEPSPLRFTPSELPEAQLGQPYDVTIKVLNNNTPIGSFYLVGDPPAGLTFTSELGQPTAHIQGTPQIIGTFSLTLTARCEGTNVSGQVGSITYQLVVAE